MNQNYNNLYGDYIGATGIHSINEYIDYTSNINYLYTSNSSNILDNKINITSNILHTYTDNSITILDNKYNKLIKEETEGILKYTYITNSNIQGQIRFITRFDTNDYRYKTRIKENGDIEVYYPDYNPVYPTMFTGWYNVMNSIRDAYNYQNIATELIGGSLLAINDIYQKYYGLVAATGASFGQITGQQLTKEKFAEITIAASKAVKYNRFSQTQAILGITGLGIAGIAASVFNGVAYDTSVRNILYDLSNLDLNIYSNITPTEKNTALSNLINDANSNTIETNISLSNLNILSGFINSNITTSQFIPSLNTNAITFNGYNISNIFLPRTGGSLYGSIAIDRSTIGIPSVGYFGGIGDRIIHYLGTPTTHPYSTGINSGSLWNSVPINSTHDWYVNGVKTMTLNNNDFILSGQIPNLQLTTTNGNNLGYATGNGYFSTNALAGDVILRSVNNLILQSGLDAALIINKTTNNVNVITTLLTSNFIYKGVELNTNTSNLSKNTILGSTPNVQKKYMFQFTCATPILMPNNVTYYKYDIDLRNYTQLKYIPNPNTPYRIFKIKLWLANGYFEYLYQNNKYNVLSYEVYMSNQSQNGGGGMGNAGINVRAFGFPESTELNTITQTQIILVRSANFNYLSCLSVFNTALVNGIIEDCLF